MTPAQEQLLRDFAEEQRAKNGGIERAVKALEASVAQAAREHGAWREQLQKTLGDMVDHQTAMNAWAKTHDERDEERFERLLNGHDTIMRHIGAHSQRLESLEESPPEDEITGVDMRPDLKVEFLEKQARAWRTEAKRRDEAALAEAKRRDEEAAKREAAWRSESHSKSRLIRFLVIGIIGAATGGAGISWIAKPANKAAVTAAP